MATSPAHEATAPTALPPAAGPWTGPVLIAEDLSQQRLPARRLVAILREAGLPADLAHVGPAGDWAGSCDSEAQPLVDLARRLKPRLIVFSILFAGRLPETLGIITALRQAGIGSHLALAGPLPSVAAGELLTTYPDLDSVLCGEPDGIIAELASAVLCDGEWQSVPGLAFRDPKGGMVARPLLALGPLDGQPTPIQDLPLPTYQQTGFATVEASRGCYHRCSFCLPATFYRAAGAPYRMRSIASLVDEMEVLYRSGARLFLFDDEQFLPPPRVRQARVKAFGDELGRRGMTVAFTLKCRPDDVDPELFQSLKEAGLVRAYVGVESGCQATLDVLAKGVTPQRNLEALATLDRLGVVADCRCLLFHPWSSLATIEEDIAFWRRALPYVPGLLSFREVEIFPGTPLAERCRAEGRTSGPPWALAYTLADPRAELLRRLGRLVFSASSIYQGTEIQVAQAWFAVLLRQRLQRDEASSTQAHRLREATHRLNADALATWSEMLDFVGREDIFDAELVNRRAGQWAEFISSASNL